ncbi:uncharacterized protein LOC130690488 [Daphnia carinata]|uniref:uncharacterized protein LOC130690488 n=1 Tax=Daphnia carinata TaxID=120202 RepID=UPI0025808296|nr:uncharacterized protein LOC130690488 [Daphnia carinata]XP_057369476.1 uncharacterized protein LOC130690488 [Daphnia carinata]
MSSTLSILMLVCLMAAIHFQPSHSIRQTSTNFNLEQLIQQGLGGLKEMHDKHVATKNALISSRKFGLGLKAGLLKPLLLVALAKIKFSLLFGKPLVLLALKKLLLHAVLGKLLLKIPLILLGGKALLLTNILAIKFALIAKGLVGLKASLALLFLGGFLKGSLGGPGLTFILGLAGSLLKLTGLGANQEEHDEPNFSSLMQNYVPARVPVYGAPPPGKAGTSSPVVSASPIISGSLGVKDFGIGISGFGNGVNGSGGGYIGIRGKREAKEENVGVNGEGIDADSPEDVQLEFEAARTNGNAYLYIAAQFDEQSCGHRLICEVYQKPRESLTEDEILLQNIFGYPLSPISEEDKGTPKESYHMAARLGYSKQGWASNQICARSYSTCPYNAQQLIQIFVSDDVPADENESNNRLVAQASQTDVRLPFYHPGQPTTVPVQQWISNVHRKQPRTRSIF